MSLAWHGAYLTEKTQSDVVAALQASTKAVTQGAVSLSHTPTRGGHWNAALRGELVCVSAEEAGWVGVWGATHRYLARMMAESRSNGILIGGEYESFDEPCRSTFWTYMLWMNGEITEWFVWQPEVCFAAWSDQSLQDTVLPYLQRQGALSLNDHSKSVRTKELVAISNWAFNGVPDLIRPFARKRISRSSIRRWLSFPPFRALDRASRVLAVPFCGLEFDPITIGLYSDVNRGTLSGEQTGQVDVDWRIMDTYKWAEDNIPRIAEIQLLVLQGANGVLQQRVLNDYPELFYWGE